MIQNSNRAVCVQHQDHLCASLITVPQRNEASTSKCTGNVVPTFIFPSAQLWNFPQERMPSMPQPHHQAQSQSAAFPARPPAVSALSRSFGSSSVLDATLSSATASPTASIHNRASPSAFTRTHAEDCPNM